MGQGDTPAKVTWGVRGKTCRAGTVRLPLTGPRTNLYGCLPALLLLSYSDGIEPGVIVELQGSAQIVL